MISLKEESSTVQSLKDEFTQRIADAERKAQLACKERDIAKKVSVFRDSVSSYRWSDVFINLNMNIKHDQRMCVKDDICLCQEIKGLREELATRLNSSDTMEIIREKEEQIRGLLEEGKTHILNMIECCSFLPTLTIALEIVHIVTKLLLLQNI